MTKKACETCGLKTPLTQKQSDLLREEEKILSALDGNSELICCMDFLTNNYGPPYGAPIKKGTRVCDVLVALHRSDGDFREFRRRTLAKEQKLQQQVGALVEACSFLADVASTDHSCVHVTSKGAQLEIADVFAALAKRLSALVEADESFSFKYVDWVAPLLEPGKSA